MPPENRFHKFHLIRRTICSKLHFRIIFPTLVFFGALVFAVNYSIVTYPVFNFCHAKTNIVFLKTHKCAGSTIQNILMRYGDFHNLTFVLPPRDNYLGHGKYFKQAFVDVPRFPVYNILAHHTRFDFNEIKKFMPSNAVFITIVRHPVQLFESSYIYFNLKRQYGFDLRKFSRLASTFNQTFINQRYSSRFGINQMLYDLGADPKIFQNDSLVEDYVDQLDSQFNLVLIAERMDESLVLLKNLLCWDTDDVLAFKLNARSQKFKDNLTAEELGNLADINRADMILYKRFLDRFERQVTEFGVNRMQQEAAELKFRRDQWSELCVISARPKTMAPRAKPKRKYFQSPYVMQFEVRKDAHNATCRPLTMEEIPFTEFLRMKQRLRLPPTKPRKYLARQPKLPRRFHKNIHRL